MTRSTDKKTEALRRFAKTCCFASEVEILQNTGPQSAKQAENELPSPSVW